MRLLWRLLTPDPPPRLRLRRVFPGARGSGSRARLPCRGGGPRAGRGVAPPPSLGSTPPLEHHYLAGAVGVLAHCGDRVDETLSSRQRCCWPGARRSRRKLLKWLSKGVGHRPQPGTESPGAPPGSAPGPSRPRRPRPRGVCVSPSPRSPAPAETAWMCHLRPSGATASISRGLRADPERAERVAGFPGHRPTRRPGGRGRLPGRALRAARRESPPGKSSQDRPDQPCALGTPPPRLREGPGPPPPVPPPSEVSPQPCHPSQMSQAGPNREESAIGEVAG